MNVTAPISIDKGDIRFGEWKGTIVYNVEFDDGEPEIFTFTIDGTEYQAEEGMTFGEWVISDYNTGKFEERDNICPFCLCRDFGRQSAWLSRPLTGSA